jgi:putative ABC transport system permease protein
MLRMWLRWSFRDLRGRWVQVAAIALVIALGTGSYAGLSSVTVWRLDSGEASYDATNMYDLRARLAVGNYVAAGSLRAALDQLSDPAAVEAVEERLLVPTQIDASTEAQTILVTGRIVGVDLSDGGPHVTGIWPLLGAPLSEAHVGADIVVLERNFAKHYELPEQGQLLLAGDRPISYIGHATSPEYFTVVTETGGFLAESTFAALFTSLETAQRLAGRPGMVNDLVLTLTPDADPDLVAAELEMLLEPVGATIQVPLDDPSYRLITEDPEGDQQFYNVFAVAIFGGAVFAAFNLTTRMVEAQRREIGIAMAIGYPTWMIAARPLLVGFQIALLGVVFGLGVGILIGNAMRGLLQEIQPLPIFETPFQLQIFLWVGLGGVAVPLLAISYPVIRAVRVAPIDAIKPTHLAARGTALAPLVRRLPIPGNTFARLPFRNLLRAPRRALLTVLGVAAVLSALVGIVGMLDSIFATIDRSDQELLGSAPDRIEVTLDTFYPVDSPQAALVLAAPQLAEAEPILELPAQIPAPDLDEDISLFLQFADLQSDLWQPTVTDGALPLDTRGIVLSAAAASDLNIGAGDTVRVQHPRRTGPASFEITETELPVVGVHPHPFRFVAYIDIRHADLVGLDGVTNKLFVRPALGEDEGSVQRALFGSAGVVSVQGVTATTDALRDAMAEFTGIFQVIEGIALLLALLIAFNAASISEDERARENATMLAYGIRVRTIMRIAVIESAIIGAIGTALGLLGGWVLLRWTVDVLFPRVLPDIRLDAVLTNTSLAIVIALGIVAVAVAPLFTIRKLRRMDIPSTLRVME